VPRVVLRFVLLSGLIPLLALATTRCEDAATSAERALKAGNTGEAKRALDSAGEDCSGSRSFLEMKGIAAEMSGDLSSAEQAFRAALTLDAKSARLMTYLGATWLAEGKAPEAAKMLEYAMTLDPSNPTTAKYLAAAYVQLNDWQRAGVALDRLGAEKNEALIRDPAVFLWLARVFIETKQSARLKDLLAAGHRPIASALLFSLGTLLAQHGMYEQAREYLERIPAADADEAVEFNLGLVYSHLRRFEAARKHYFSATDRHPNYVEAYFHVGLDYAASGEARRAIPWLLRARESSPERAAISYALAEQLIGLEYFQTAEQVVTAALERTPTDALLQTAEGDVKQAKGDAAGSIQNYERILLSHPGFAPAMIGMARASASEGDDQRAMDTLRAVLSKEPANADANGELGSIEVRRNEWKAALEHLNRARVADQANSKVALELARALVGASRPEEALKLIMSLPADVRSSRGAHIVLEKIYMQLHRDTDAEAERAALRLQAQHADILRFTNPGTYVY